MLGQRDGQVLNQRPEPGMHDHALPRAATHGRAHAAAGDGPGQPFRGARTIVQ